MPEDSTQQYSAQVLVSAPEALAGCTHVCLIEAVTHDKNIRLIQLRVQPSKTRDANHTINPSSQKQSDFEIWIPNCQVQGLEDHVYLFFQGFQGYEVHYTRC